MSLVPKLQKDEPIKLQTLIPAKDRLDLFQFHPYTSLKAVLIKSQSGKWTLHNSVSYFPFPSPWVTFHTSTIVPQLSCSFQMMSNQEVHNRGWLITSPDACILAILFGNREIKERRDICCQAPTLERPEMHLSVLKWFQWCIKPLRNLPNAITPGDYVPYSTLG